MSTNSRPAFERGKQVRPRSLRPKQILLVAVFRDALQETVRGVKPLLGRRWVFDNAGYPERGCPSDALARAYDDALDALKAAPLAGEQRLEQALALPRAMEMAARARFGPTPVLALTDLVLQEGRADAMADPHEQELLADPSCPTKQRRLLDVWKHQRARIDAGIQWLQRHVYAGHRGAA